MSAKSEWKYYLIASTPFTAIFFIIPFELYFNNQEYWNWNYGIPGGFGLLGVFLYLLLGLVLRSRLRKNNPGGVLTSVCLFWLGLCVLLADLFAPLQTNLLDGSKLVSSEPFAYSLIEGAILAGIILSWKRLGVRQASSIAVALSVVLLIVSVAYFCLIVTSSKPVVGESAYPGHRSDIRGNVYHIVLDEMQSDAAMIYLQEQTVQKRFLGFTVFKNNVSNYLYTRASLPSYLTGTLYDGGENSFEVWERGFKEGGILKDVRERGYRIIMFSARHHWHNPYVADFVTLDDIYEQRTGLEDGTFNKDFVQIWFARIMPNFLTNEALSIGRKFGQFVYEMINRSRALPVTLSEGKEPFSSMLLLKHLRESEKDRAANGQYIYAHVLLPHGPYVVNEDCQYDPEARHAGTKGYWGQVKCALRLVGDFLDELKRLGRYNDATIVIHADTGHGHRGLIRKAGFQILGTVDARSGNVPDPWRDNPVHWPEDQLIARTMALLMMKPAHRLKEVTFSDKTSQLIDLYPTLADLLELDLSGRRTEGASLFSEGFPKNRRRSFFLYPPGEDNPSMVEVTLSDQKNMFESELIFRRGSQKTD